MSYEILKPGEKSRNLGIYFTFPSPCDSLFANSVRNIYAKINTMSKKYS